MNFRFNRIFLICFTLVISLFMISIPIEAKKKSKSRKAAGVSKSKKKRVSKKRSSRTGNSRKKVRSSSNTNSRNSWNNVYREASSYTQGGATPPDREVKRSSGYAHGTTVSAAKPESKRKIKIEKPDLEKIRRETLDPASKFYFPKLKEKYEVNDTTMTPEEFRNFYLGYMFQEDFDPYRISPYSNVTDDLRMKPVHSKEEIDTITKYALLALEDNPFDLRQMSFLVHVLKEKRKDMRAKIWEYRLENLLGAIKSTGNGEDVDNAWYVIYPTHEYDMVQLLGYEATAADYIEPGYDYLTVQPDETDTRKRDKSAKGFYFNIIVPQQQYELKHPEESVGTDTDDAGVISSDNMPAQ
ncbi:MAG: DUF4919 domain-containing protein [Candidatus Amulumruptor caecigallinarius]|nr:DUF4919 domain-containing protein [Candidatus Amulumruptor caecigallinarius]